MSSVSKKVVIDLADDDDAWDALDEAEGITNSAADKGKGKERDSRPNWLPDGLDPVLEELPKWHLLSEILREAEGEIIRQENLKKPALPGMFSTRVFFFFFLLNTPSANATSSNTILVMTSSTRTCSLLTEFLSTMDLEASPGSQGRQMMMKKLRLYLWWKGKLSQRKQDGKTAFPMPNTKKDDFGNYGDQGEISEALKKKDKEKAEKSKSRRRVRGGAPAGSSSSRADNASFPKPEPKDIKLDEIQNEADHFAQL